MMNFTTSSRIPASAKPKIGETAAPCRSRPPASNRRRSCHCGRAAAHWRRRRRSPSRSACASSMRQAERPRARIPDDRRDQQCEHHGETGTAATWRINSTGKSETMPKATAPDDHSTPNRSNMPDQTTATLAGSERVQIRWQPRSQCRGNRSRTRSQRDHQCDEEQDERQELLILVPVASIST